MSKNSRYSKPPVEKDEEEEEVDEEEEEDDLSEASEVVDDIVESENDEEEEDEEEDDENDPEEDDEEEEEKEEKELKEEKEEVFETKTNQVDNVNPLVPAPQKKKRAKAKRNVVKRELIPEEEDNDMYLQKFDEKLRMTIIDDYHPELKAIDYDQVLSLSKIIRDKKTGIIVDPYHKTFPFVTKYERARVLGERANQIENGSDLFVTIPPEVIDSYLIALEEYKQKKIPFIIQRPLPNGACEYWKLSDLEI